jgi:DeoR/GlpR family transcriptional regulator of sugar metabolism
MVEHARRHVAAVDHTKQGKVAKWRICQARSLHTIVTDTAATDAMIAPFRDMGDGIIRAPK